MPFSSQRLPPALIAELERFVRENDLCGLYRSYSWRRDTHGAGFPDILRLERQLTQADMTTGIGMEEVQAVAEWGKPTKRGSLSGPPVCVPARTLHGPDGSVQPGLHTDPTAPIRHLQEVKGLGPT